MATGRLPETGATFADLTSTQTLTNKTLTSPVLTTPTISTIDAKGDLLAGTADNTIASLAVGTNGQVLTADSAEATGLKYATPSSGAVVQVKSMSTTTSTSSTSSTYADSTITLSITPTSASNKILALVSVQGVLRAAVQSGVGIKLLRGATVILTPATNFMYTDSGGGTFVGSLSTTYLDSPATTSATTYKIQFASINNINNVVVQNDSNPSTITLMEVIP